MTYLVGQQLGRYLIQEEIGRGGMAHVYRALDTLLQRTVALKVLTPQLAIDPEFARRFEREAITAANLHHPNIVTIFDVGEHNGLRYIAMEYVRGRTLHAIIEERGALGLGYAIAIVGPVAAALDHAHGQGAVHRDVKPQNVMIDTDGRVLLTDFGIAQAPEGRGGERLTRTGIFMGTPEYISPEQASAQRVDGRSDLYSLGIATYEIITGVVPFSGATPQLIIAHVQNQPPPPSSVDPTQPRELDLVLARILAKRPEQRFANGAAFVEALRIVARKHGIATPTPRQLADLALPRASSEGQQTMSLGRGQTPRQLRAPIVVTPQDPILDDDDEPVAAPPARPRPVRTTAPPPVRPRPVAPRPLDDDETFVRPEPLPPPVNGGGPRVPWTIAGPVLGGLFLVLLLVLFRNVNGTNLVPTPTPTPRAVDTPFPTIVTSTPTFTPLPTSTPTQEPTQTLTPTEEMPPTPTPAPPQPTKRPPQPTPVPEPPTPVPIPSTPTPEPLPPTPVPPTLTLEPPPVTPSQTSPPVTPTSQAISPSPAPTATATVFPPTATPTAPPTPTATLTLTPQPTASFTPTATNTLTPTLTLTATP